MRMLIFLLFDFYNPIYTFMCTPFKYAQLC